MKNSCKLHKDFLWLNRIAQTVNNSINLLLILFFIHINFLYNQSHNLSKILFVFMRKHAYHIKLHLYKCHMIKINVLNHFLVNVLILIDQIIIKVFKKQNVPVYNQLSCLSLMFFLLFIHRKIIVTKLLSQHIQYFF